MPAPAAEERLLDVTHGWDAKSATEAAARRELPRDVLELATRRLGVACVAQAALLGAFLMVAWLGAPSGSTLRAEVFPSHAAFLGVAILLNLAMVGVCRAPGLAPQLVLDLSVAYLLATALTLGLMRHQFAWTDQELLRSWSPVALLLLLYGALVPSRPERMLWWALAAAAMDPLALYLLRGTFPALRPDQVVLLFVSPLGGALLAVLCSSAIYGLSERITKAREIGSYRLVERLGVGGMGEVWRADHLMLARPAAIKLVRPSVLAGHGPEEARRLVKLFDREARATAALSSPHTIQVYDFGVTEDGTFYYVMELLNGFDLQTLVERFGPQSPERAAYLVSQAAESLFEAHEASLVHRDVKPANVYSCRSGQDVDFVKVLDFGLVMDRRPTAEELEAAEGRLTGTPAVMAPEMLRFDSPVDQRADIYALGCVLYWLLTGARVFEAESRADMLVMHSHQKPDTPSKRAGVSVPEALEALVMQCLDKNPNRRPQTARELADALGNITFEHPWTRERAQLWWRKNAPAPTAA